MTELSGGVEKASKSYVFNCSLNDGVVKTVLVFGQSGLVVGISRVVGLSEEDGT